jgi:hypothetical protein
VGPDDFERLAGEPVGDRRTDVLPGHQLGRADAGPVLAGAEETIVGDLVADRERHPVRGVACDVTRVAVRRRGDRHPNEGDTHLPGLLHNANGQLSGLLAVLLVHEKLVALLEHDHFGRNH